MIDGGMEQWAGPAVDGSEEAKQVEMFLESEHAAMQKAFDDDLNDPITEASPPPQVEVYTQNLMQCVCVCVCVCVIAVFDNYCFFYTRLSTSNREKKNKKKQQKTESQHIILFNPPLIAL